jgi:hypothetical protein
MAFSIVLLLQSSTVIFRIVITFTEEMNLRLKEMSERNSDGLLKIVMYRYSWID